jgi:hypothetical protein
MEQQLPQKENFATNTVVVDLVPSSSKQAPQDNQARQLEIGGDNDQHQDSKEEIKVVVAEELTYLQQENECLKLEQENTARRRAVMHRAQIMQQQIEQERARQAELQQAIKILRCCLLVISFLTQWSFCKDLSM